MEVGGEEGGAAQLGHEVLGDGPGEAKAVVGGGAAAELVDDDEGARGGALQDGGRLQHLRHERRDARQLTVAGAHARKNAVTYRDGRAVARHEAADLRHQHVHAHLHVTPTAHSLNTQRPQEICLWQQ